MENVSKRLKIGDKARTVDGGINVRSGPKSGGKKNIITQFGRNVEMTIVDGPEYNSEKNIYWWKIESDDKEVKAYLKEDNNNEAWIAECSGDEYFLEPFTPGIPSQPVSPQPVNPLLEVKTTSPATGVTRHEGERHGRRYYLTICNPANVTIKVVHEYNRPSVIAKRAGAKFGFNGDDWDKRNPNHPTMGVGFSNGVKYRTPTSGRGEPSLIITQKGNVSIGTAGNKGEWNVTSGVRYLVKGGKNLIPPKGTEPKYTERHARSVRGLDNLGHVMFLTVDGEFFPPHGPSTGMTFWEAAELMLEFGCVIAFDGGGGGDSVDVVDGIVANVPQDKGERFVPQTILVFPK